MSSLIAPTKDLGYSKIYLDFILKKDSVGKFYPAESFEQVIKNLEKHTYFRSEVTEILKKQNTRYNTGPKTFKNIELLKDNNTIAICTGQQAGLFGGSLLILIKALALAKSAEQYSRQLNRPVVPVFWIAGDDHDYEEVNHTYVLDRASEIVKVSYDTIPQIENPTAELLFDDNEELEKAKELLKSTLGDSDFTKELYDLLDACYTNEDTYVTAFGKFMAALTKDYGIVYFSPGDAESKQLSVPLFKSIIQNQEKLHEFLSQTNNSLEQDGFHLQVEKKDNSAHLFMKSDGRKPILSENGSFMVGEKRFTEAELLELIDKEPERFSPDVMTRPILQSYLFPTLSQKGGAAEIAYLAQMHKLFDLFDLPTPYYKARPTATIVESRFEKMMSEHDIKFEELVGDIEVLINRIMEKSFPDGLEEKYRQVRSHIKAHFEDFADESLKFDPSLKQFSEQIYGKIDFNLNAFEGKIFSSHKKKSQEERDRIYRLWHSLYPNRTFQERVLNVSYFISRYSFEFIDLLYNSLESEIAEHQLIYISEMKK